MTDPKNVPKKTDSVVQSFEDLKDQKVPAGAKSSIGSTAEIMLEVFKQYKDTPFTQENFVVKLGISNPFANHQLHALMKKGLIERIGSRRKYWYNLKSPQ